MCDDEKHVFRHDAESCNTKSKFALPHLCIPRLEEGFDMSANESIDRLFEQY